MSEKHIVSNNHPETRESSSVNDHKEFAQKIIHEKAERARLEKSNENIEKIRELANAEAQESVDLSNEGDSATESEPVIGMQHILKATAFSKTLARTQNKLPRLAKTFSKITHNVIVDKISDTASATVARPSGFLGGSIFAFFGSATVYYYSKHYGFKYNYLLIVMFFVGGYVVGSFIELLLWVFYFRKQRY